jgi:DNA-binding protein H-NS
MHLLSATNCGVIMTEFSEITRNKSRFRAACKGLNIAQLQTMAQHLSEFIEKRAQEEAVRAEQSAKKNVERKTILAAIAKAGLTPEDLFSADATQIKKTRKPVVPKYHLTDEHGVKHEWSGRGRTPKVFDYYFNNGGSKDSCLI